MSDIYDEFDPGEFANLVVWQQPTYTQGRAGQDVPSYPPAGNGTFLGKIEALSGRELFVARQAHAAVTHRVTVRNIGAVKAVDRFVDSVTGDVFNVNVAKPRRINSTIVGYECDCTQQASPQPQV